MIVEEDKGWGKEERREKREDRRQETEAECRRMGSLATRNRKAGPAAP
jgi:hypothetical protein